MIGASMFLAHDSFGSFGKTLWVVGISGLAAVLCDFPWHGLCVAVVSAGFGEIAGV
jgi:hypothetical protein